MKRVLKFEFYKLLKQKSFYYNFIAMLLLSALSIFASKILIKLSAKLSEEDAKAIKDAISTNSRWAMLTAFSNANFSILCGVFTVLCVCAEFGKNQTIKNVYARGFSPRQVFWAKAIVVGVAVSVMYFVLVGFSFGMGALAFGGEKGPNGRYFACMFGQYLLALAYAYLAFFYSITFKKTVIATVFVLVVTNLFDGIMVIISMIISKKFGFNPADYWLSNFLVKFMDIAITGKALAIRCALTLAYIALFIVGGYFINKKHKC